MSPTQRKAMEQVLIAAAALLSDFVEDGKPMIRKEARDVLERMRKARAALVEQPAEPQQEPVAWQHRKPIEDSYGNTRGASDWLPGKGLEWWTHRALYAAPPARNQCKFPLCQNEDYQQALAEQIKQELYTGEPAQRKPLTDEDIDQVTDTQWASNNHKPIYAAHRAYARAIERAHGIGGQP